MNHDKNDDRTCSPERPAFAALWAFLLAPIIAQGVWRPLQHLLGSTGQAGQAGLITGAALAVCATVFFVQLLRPRQTPLLASALGSVVAIAAALGCGLGLPGLLTLLIVAAALAFFLQRLSAQLPTSLDGLARRHKLLFVLYFVLALFAVVKTAQLSMFIGDSARLDRQVVPGDKFLDTHSCLTAYVHADTLSRARVDNLYAERYWLGSAGFPPAPANQTKPYHPFELDYYAYPPPFLLVMAPLALFAGDFAAQRALWFGLNGLLLAVGLWIVARWLDGENTHRVLLLAPLLFASLPILVTLQVGNFQIAVVVISVLAMVAFQKDQPVIGGSLLAFAILSKISPGVLGIVLLSQRRFRCAGWTAGFGVLFVALSLLTVGIQPMKAFLTYTLSRISSGEAFSFLDDSPFSILTNMSPFGLPFKLQLIGVQFDDPWRMARLIGRIYSVVLAVLAFVAVRRTGDRRSQAVTWMSLLVLAALQSPFAPGYVCIGLLWAITLLATDVRSVRGGLSLGLLWLLFAVFPPFPSLKLLALYGLLQSALCLGVPSWLIIRAMRPASPYRTTFAGSAEQP